MYPNKPITNSRVEDTLLNVASTNHFEIHNIANSLHPRFST